MEDKQTVTGHIEDLLTELSMAVDERASPGLVQVQRNGIMNLLGENYNFFNPKEVRHYITQCANKMRQGGYLPGD
jgi:hypothetical protein